MYAHDYYDAANGDRLEYCYDDRDDETVPEGY